MFNAMRFWPQPLLGLDIQDEEIRLLQLHGTGKKRKIQQALTLSLPVGAVIKGEIQETEVVSYHLQELVLGNKLKEFEVAIALPAHRVVSKPISVTKGLHESELEAEIISQLSHCFPDIKEGLCYDYVIMGSSDEMQNDVLLVATSFTHLNTSITAVQNAGFKVRVVDVDYYASDRASQLIEKYNFQLEKKWLVSFGLALRSYSLW